MRKLDALLLVAAPLLMAACSGVPSDVIEPEKMARLMADLEIAESVVEMRPGMFRGDSAKLVLAQSVYRRHGVTSAEVDSSLSWYGRHIDRYREVAARTVEMLQTDEEASRLAVGHSPAPEQHATASLDGDSVDVWPLARFWRISSTSPSQVIRFNLSRDRNWEPGDGYELRFKTMGGHVPVDVTLAADGQRSQRWFVNERRRGNGWQTVSLRLDSASGASQVYGSIIYIPRGRETFYIDSLQLLRTHWKPSRAAVPAGQHLIDKR